jgi:superfamily I DNA/RNA helicase/mRNA-degrading endonuclease RelE of RelBE toxin-antitoxin system
MEFLIADTFTDSLTRLTGDEQKLVKTTAFDLQLNPASPGMNFHKLDKAKDKNFWSVRVGSDLRLIVHKTGISLLLCYVDHHDKAYSWAERRKLETHPKTGAAQLVEVRESIREVAVPRYVEVDTPVPLKRKLFANLTNDDLLSYGVPADWVDEAKAVDNDELLFDLVGRLPNEAAEALLELAVGGKPAKPVQAPAGAQGEWGAAFAHPDAQRRFRVMSNVDELTRALDAPWEKWTVFLHPAQRQWIEKNYNGPARVSGSAGTGKTIVALHRAVFLARQHPDSRVLLTTFSDTLANALRTKLRRLISNEPLLGERVEVASLDTIGRRLFKPLMGTTRFATSAQIRESLEAAAAEIPGHKFSTTFLLGEWTEVVDAQQLRTWESYRDVKRMGRKTRLPEKQRAVLWSIFADVRSRLTAGNLITVSEMFGRLSEAITAWKTKPFDFAVVDEAQDLSLAQLRFLAAMAAKRTNSLFFAGDVGQRIFQQPYSWLAAGVDIRGRARTLTVNYRTSHQIRTQADRLLAAQVTDADGNAEERNKTVSLFDGAAPTIRVCKTQDEETRTVAGWVKGLCERGVLPHEFGVFIRSQAQLDRAVAAVVAAGLPYRVLDEQVDGTSGHAAISTMHLAKGLEFRAVVVMACDDEIIPLQERVETVADEADLEEVYSTERHLLYVACTRARDHLLVTSVAPASEFLEDLRVPASGAKGRPETG